MSLTAETKAKLRDLVADPYRFIRGKLFIRNMAGRVVRFRPNPVQRRIWQIKQEIRASGRRVRVIVLKARRHGVTTWEQAESFTLIATTPNKNALSIAHNADSTVKIFRISDLYHQRLDTALRPSRLTKSNKREINYPGMNSLFYIGTAGGDVGRSDTLQRVHWSEVAWSPGDLQVQTNLLAGLSEAAREGEIVLESTPKGSGGFFHQTWKQAKEPGSTWRAVFIPWWEDTRTRIELNEEQAAEIVASLSDEEKDLVAKHSWAPEQVAWRRAKKKEPEMQRGMFDQEYAEDDITCFLVSGTHWFDMTIIRDLLQTCPAPLEVRRDGEMEIYKNHEKGHHYAIGADAGEGLPNSDWSTGCVLDVMTGEQVARFRGRYDVGEHAHRLAQLGKLYGYPLIGVERNNHGHAVLLALRDIEHYPKIYRHRDWDAAKRKGGAMKLGFPTLAGTRTTMLHGLRMAVEDGSMIVFDRGFLDETTTFVKHADGKYAAENDGQDWDDLVFGWGIAWAIRGSRQAVQTLDVEYDPKKFSKMMGGRIHRRPRGRIN